MTEIAIMYLGGFALGTIHGLPLIIALVIWGLKTKKRLESERKYDERRGNRDT